jgi:carbonic anhydrase
METLIREPETMDTDWIEIRSCTWLHEAHFLKSVLEGAGIEVLIPHEHTLGVQPAFGFLHGGVRVLVRSEDRDRAEELLASAGPQAPDSGSGELPVRRVAARLGSGALLALSIVVLLSCAEQPPHWGYTGEAGPAHWAGLSKAFAACATGTRQSPIDIQTPADSPDLPPIALHYGGRTTAMVNNGHALQVNVEPGNWLHADGQRWDLAQIHYHSPSEHLIDGVRFPLEGHFVHRNERGELAVVAQLFRDGAVNSRLPPFWTGLPAQRGGTAPLTVPLADLGPNPDLLSHYRYDGSLTTPPCSEGVRWYVLQTFTSTSREQVAALVDVFGENSRPVQPRNNRPVHVSGAK